MQSSTLMESFKDKLKDIYRAEKALTNAIPKIIKNATSTELIEVLTSHLAKSEEQVSRLEQVVELLVKEATVDKCESVTGLITETERVIDKSEAGIRSDTDTISAGQKVEHYEIVSYGILHKFAETLGLTEAATLLETTLDEEKVNDEKLTEIAVSAVNIEAAEEKETK